MNNKFIFIAMALTLSACATDKQAVLSVAEQVSGYTYIPVDPFPVKTVPGESCKGTNGELLQLPFKDLLASLPDNAVRMLVEQLDTSGTVTYGESNVKGSANSYKVTLDYINSDTINVPVWIAKTMTNNKTGEDVYIPLFSTVDNAIYQPGSESYTVIRTVPAKNDNTPYVQFNIPVYIGIGLRATSIVNILDASVHLSGLGVIGADAQANKLTGTLIIQSLGINSKSISSVFPVESTLNQTSVENALVAVGTMKSEIYNTDTNLNARVVGLNLPFPSVKPLVNALVSALSDSGPNDQTDTRLSWHRPCVSTSKPVDTAQKK
jgi:hypothetical protein